MNVKITIEPLGVFQEIVNLRKLGISIDSMDQSKESNTISKVLEKIIELASEKQTNRFPLDISDYFEKALILVNGVEIGLLKGLDTRLKNGDRLTIIPVSHGG
jgi:molybdopterin converting factor small subunit